MPEQRICTIAGCDKPEKARKLCNMHYKRLVKHGDVNFQGDSHRKIGKHPTGICEIDGCSHKHLARGMCHKHYQQARAYGPKKPKLKMRPVKYLSFVIEFQGDQCLPWPYERSNSGYGRITIDGRVASVHRVVCQRIHGVPPTDQHQAAHTCSNGHLGCVNPKHLYWATPTQNAADRMKNMADHYGYLDTIRNTYAWFYL